MRLINRCIWSGGGSKFLSEGYWRKYSSSTSMNLTNAFLRRWGGGGVMEREICIRPGKF